MRTLCTRLDDLVYPVIENVVKAGLIPIVVGGGHNNAYPILKGTARALGATGGISCVNCDPHADFRELEGRHSGNGFSYAYADGFLSRYFILGLHQNYNPSAVLEKIDRMESAAYVTFDSMADVADGLEQVLRFFKGVRQPVGIELDMDSIVNMPSSAMTPSGFTVEEARKFMRVMAVNLKCAYVHLPEGAPSDNSDQMITVGKTLAYLIADFIRFNSS